MLFHTGQMYENKIYSFGKSLIISRLNSINNILLNKNEIFRHNIIMVLF